MRSVTIGCLLLLLVGLGGSRAYGQLQRYTFSRGLFGTEFRLIFYAPSDSMAQVARQVVYARMDSLNAVMSDYLDGSEINRLSATAGNNQWVPVSPYLFEVLQRAVQIADQSRGLYDPTIGPLSQLWRRAVRRKVFPTKRELRAAHRLVNYQYIAMDTATHRVKLRRAGMRLDVGGIGQGYANDKGLELLAQVGIQSALLDIGGDIRVSNPPPGERGWRIQSPDRSAQTGRSESKADTMIALQNAAITTSGATYRFLEHNGKRYSHLLNPRTGLGLLHHVRTTVLAPDGTRADALTKVFSVARPRQRRALSGRFPEVSVWVTTEEEGRQQTWQTVTSK